MKFAISTPTAIMFFNCFAACLLAYSVQHEPISQGDIIRRSRCAMKGLLQKGLDGVKLITENKSKSLLSSDK